MPGLLLGLGYPLGHLPRLPRRREAQRPAGTVRLSTPALGVGVVYLPGLEALAVELADACTVFEIEPQAFWFKRSGPGADRFAIDEVKFEALLELGKPVLVHSVGCPVASTNGFDDRQLDGLRRSLEILKPAWWSDHASFVSTGTGDERRAMGFLMPPAQTHESAAMIVDRIKRLQDLFGLPFAFETGVNYFAPRTGEMPDGAFWGEIAVRADCGILLDLHNIWSNQHNGRDDTEAVLAQLPRDHVWEIHVAGGQDHKGYWLDSHCGLPQPEIIELLGRAAPALANLKAINFEIIPEYVDAENITAADIRDLLDQLRTIWYAAKSPTADEGRESCASEPDTRTMDGDRDGPSPGAWEDHVRETIAARCRGEPLAPEADPAFDIYLDLILMARRGSIVDVLPLTTRYLWLMLGERALDALLLDYFSAVGPEQFMADEARNFARFAACRRDLPHLAEVTAFEFAAQAAAQSGENQLVGFSCDPVPLLTAIRHGVVPDALPAADIEVEVRPPARTG